MSITLGTWWIYLIVFVYGFFCGELLMDRLIDFVKNDKRYCYFCERAK